MKYIYDLDISDLKELMVNLDEKKYRAQQLFAWLYLKRVSSFKHMSNLGNELIAYLAQNYAIAPLDVAQLLVSKDGTKKYLFELQDGNVIETVLMKYEHGYCVCVSSQVGCNMGCSFCASGKLKKVRDLSCGEMVLQILHIQNELAAQAERISNVVVMGIGEPFDNYDNVIKFIKIINHDKGLAIGARHISVSTCGLVPEIAAFAKLDLQVNLAVSLHSAIETKRNQIMPINQRYNLELLKRCLVSYQKQTNRRLTFEYILLKGFNDEAADIKALKAFLKGLNAYINIIPFNDINEQIFKSLTRNECYYFYQKLKQENINATIRKDFGSDIAAACGQLRAKKEAML